MLNPNQDLDDILNLSEYPDSDIQDSQSNENVSRNPNVSRETFSGDPSDPVKHNPSDPVKQESSKDSKGSKDPKTPKSAFEDTPFMFGLFSGCIATILFILAMLYLQYDFSKAETKIELQKDGKPDVREVQKTEVPLHILRCTKIENDVCTEFTEYRITTY